MEPALNLLIEAWDWSYLDFDASLAGLSQEHLHQRPSPKVMAVSETIAHLARSEASIVLRYLAGQPAEVWADRLFLRPPYGWPPDVLDREMDQDLAAMSLEEVRQELQSTHQRCLESARNLSLPLGHRFEDDWAGPAPTVKIRLQFAAYHVAYHVGQIYTIRHMLGDETPDN